MVAILIFLKGKYIHYINILIISACAILFVQNVNLLITEDRLNPELFYELGGIFLILIVSYFKLKEEF